MFRMKHLFKSIDKYILKKISKITIKKANIFTIVFTFLFTSIFAYLLIIENYNDYERALLTQASLHDKPLSVDEGYNPRKTQKSFN